MPSFSSSPQGIDSARVSTPQNLPSKAKQMLMPGGQPGGGGGRQGMGWGVDCLCWIWGRPFNICLILFSQVWGYLNLSLPDVEIFDCRLGQKRLRLNICFPLPHFTHAPRSGKIWKSWRPTRTSQSRVDFTVLSSNFVCFTVFLIN